MTPIVFLDGRFLAAAEAAVSVFDASYLHGAGLYETIRAEQGRAFRLETHLDRMVRSAGALHIPIHRRDLPTQEVVSELLTRNGLTRARVRITLSGRSTHAETSDAEPRPSICVTAADLASYSGALYESGSAVVVCDFRLSPTDPLAGHKTTSYLPRLLGLHQAHEARCVEALWFTTANVLAEGCLSNVFVVRRGAIATPGLDTPVLPGIARSLVLELCRSQGMDMEEKALTIDDLLGADEVLLTNSIMQVVPVIRVEKHDIGEGRVGPIACELLAEYRRTVKAECGGR
jgi:branched-subunit amino acid aminotransferase/4-amino-4-deoxychorismate lyase